jgi:CheY-like chemotaxis protein
MAVHRVLIVEDDPEIRDSLVEILEDNGFEPMAAENGLEALDKLRAPGARPCVIFLDLMLPLMDGKAFRQEMLRIPEFASIPVVVVSAFRDVAQLTQEMHVAEILKKPFKLQDFIMLARRHCSEVPEAS